MGSGDSGVPFHGEERGGRRTEEGMDHWTDKELGVGLSGNHGGVVEAPDRERGNQDQGEACGSRLRSNLLTNASLLLGSCAVTALLFEAVARLAMPPPLPWIYPQLRYSPDGAR